MFSEIDELGGDAYGFEVCVEPFGHFDDVGTVCCVSADSVFIFVVSTSECTEERGSRGWAYEGMATASASLSMKALALVSTKERNSGGAGMLGDGP